MHANRCSCWGLLEAILKKSKTVAHCGKTCHHREPAINAHKKIVAIVHLHQQGATVRGGKTSDLSVGFGLERTKFTGMTASDKTTVIWKILEKKRMIWKSPNFDPPPASIDGAGWRGVKQWINSAVQDKKVLILAVFYSCCSYNP